MGKITAENTKRMRPPSIISLLNLDPSLRGTPGTPPRQASILGRVTELDARSTVYQRNCGNLERRNNRGERVCAVPYVCNVHGTRGFRLFRRFVARGYTAR